ncbi:MAG: caspase family protein [Gammaproteobacteria bacterium]|nr:caspase family protein [Gammaproteobacteria bacterium]
MIQKQVIFVLLLLVISTHSYARDRIALVIGNANYDAQPLSNPVNDARDISEKLRKLNFDVTFIYNANQQQMELAIQSFGEKLHSNSVGLFYFSGHGVQHEGNNYLIPISAMSRVSAPDHLRYKTVDAGYILGVMKQSGSGLNMVFLDACRNNPFKSFSRSMGRGLARISGAEGTLIAYSTSPGKVALDGSGRNSPYTYQLLNLMEQPNLPIELLLKKVRANVKSQTGGKQSPWYEASIDGDFYFIPIPVQQHISPEPRKADQSPKTIDGELWFVIMGSYTHSKRGKAISRKNTLTRQKVDSYIIDTDHYSNLRNGLYAVVVGPYRDS